MSWTTDDGLHEGWVAPEFIDGRRGIGVSGGSIPIDHVAVGATHSSSGDPAYETRPAAEVIGWRVVCHCRSAGGELKAEADRWHSDLIARVPSKSLEDPDKGRIYATDTDVVDVDDIHTEMFHRRWHNDHGGAVDTLARIGRTLAQIAALQQDLDAAVTAARSTGQSWEAIARAAGISRQAAHERWSRLSVNERSIDRSQGRPNI